MKYKEVPENEANNIWTKNHFRVFLSHNATFNEKASELKRELKGYGICAFVEHDEIEKALLSMEAFVALVTEDFYDSDWTSQEIGFSQAFEIPRIYVDLGGGSPKGLAANIQVLKCNWNIAYKEIFETLLKFESVRNAFLDNLKDISNYLFADEFYDCLITFDLNKEQCDKIILAYNNNSHINGNYKFNGMSGPGIIPYLNKWTGKQYELDEANKITLSTTVSTTSSTL
ncbi:MAG: toll/interleukin-1 receptor domain-containing protein [Fibromonadaceae bacterium]|jgi:hypothetical protein|nr:toll/interleukin-1 receptor domain-containing protein [Fibromonadaceae bacterium]